jgi:hypothetical protein
MRLLVLAAVVVSACSSSAENVPADAGVDTSDAPLPPPTSITFGDPERFVIASGDGDHLAFPDVTRLPDGQLLLVYRRGATHVDSTGRLMKQLGSADGRTWSAPEVLYDTPDIDDRDPSVMTTKKGEVLVNWFQYVATTTSSGTLTTHEVFALRSTDGGKTFAPFGQITKGQLSIPGATKNGAGLWVDEAGKEIVVGAASSAIVEFGSRLILPTYGGMALATSVTGIKSPPSRITLFESTDGAATFTEQPVNPDADTAVWLQEPALLPLADRWLMHARSADGASPGNPGKLLQAVSTDEGRTWSSWEPFPFVGHAPELIELTGGVIISAFRELDDAYTHEWVSLVTSIDAGHTWSDPIRIRDCRASECGYPGLIELSDSRLLVVYYAPGGRSIDAAIYPFTIGRE